MKGASAFHQVLYFFSMTCSRFCLTKVQNGLMFFFCSSAFLNSLGVQCGNQITWHCDWVSSPWVFILETVHIVLLIRLRILGICKPFFFAYVQHSPNANTKYRLPENCRITSCLFPTIFTNICCEAWKMNSMASSVSGTITSSVLYYKFKPQFS